MLKTSDPAASKTWALRPQNGGLASLKSIPHAETTRHKGTHCGKFTTPEERAKDWLRDKPSQWAATQTRHPTAAPAPKIERGPWDRVKGGPWGVRRCSPRATQSKRQIEPTPKSRLWTWTSRTLRWRCFSPPPWFLFLFSFGREGGCKACCLAKSWQTTHRSSVRAKFSPDSSTPPPNVNKVRRKEKHLKKQQRILGTRPPPPHPGRKTDKHPGSRLSRLGLELVKPGIHMLILAFFPERGYP